MPLLLGAWPFVHTLPEKAHILDVGAGTGIVSLMMAQRFSGAVVAAWEVEDGALRDAATNFAASPFADRLRIHSQDYLHAKREQWHPFDLSSPILLIIPRAFCLMMRVYA